MTEDQIERHVETLTDRLDAAFLADNSKMTQDQYDAEIKAINDWAEYMYVRADKFRAAQPFTAKDRRFDF